MLYFELESNHKEVDSTITVIGLGDGACKTIDNLFKSNIPNLFLVAVNTCDVSLNSTNAHKKLQIGWEFTKGKSTGGDFRLARIAAENETKEIRDIIKNTKILILIGCLGWGTASGALPIFSKIAKEMNVLTLSIVTTPFFFEGQRAKNIAENTLSEIEKYIDSIITISNNNLITEGLKEIDVNEGFKLIDDIIYKVVVSILEIMFYPGLVNIDFADMEMILKNSGNCIISITEFSIKDNPIDIASKAISNPLLNTTIIHNAKKILLYMSGEIEKYPLFKWTSIANYIKNKAPNDVVFNWGNTSGFNLFEKDNYRLILFATKGASKSKILYESLSSLLVG